MHTRPFTSFEEKFLIVPPQDNPESSVQKAPAQAEPSTSENASQIAPEAIEAALTEESALTDLDNLFPLKDDDICYYLDLENTGDLTPPGTPKQPGRSSAGMDLAHIISTALRSTTSANKHLINWRSNRKIKKMRDLQSSLYEYSQGLKGLMDNIAAGKLDDDLSLKIERNINQGGRVEVLAKQCQKLIRNDQKREEMNKRLRNYIQAYTKNMDRSSDKPEKQTEEQQKAIEKLAMALQVIIQNLKNIRPSQSANINTGPTLSPTV